MQIEKDIEIQESEIPEPLKVVIFRVMQESLTNAAKHAKADTLTVRLAKNGDRIELAVSDNGVGFELARAAGNEAIDRGFGLVSMRERVQLSGGRFAIESCLGQGTNICAQWPMTNLNRQEDH